MKTMMGWAASLTLWGCATAAMTGWPDVQWPWLRAAYAAIWSAWGWLPVTLGYTTVQSARALRSAAQRTLDTHIPEWCDKLADRSSQIVLAYLDQQTITLAQRQQQARELVDLWQPRIEQARNLLQDPELQAMAAEWIPLQWRSRIKALIDSPIPAEQIELARQSVEAWLHELEQSVAEARRTSVKPLAQWMTEQTRGFVIAWYQAHVAPQVHRVLIGYRIWLAMLSLWALLPWLGWLLLGALA